MEAKVSVEQGNYLAASLPLADVWVHEAAVWVPVSALGFMVEGSLRNSISWRVVPEGV